MSTDTKKTPNAQEAADAAAAAEVKKLQKQNAELTKMLAEATERNAALAATKGNKNPTVTHEGNTYQTNGPIRWKGEILKPEQYIHMPEVIKHLLKTNGDTLTRIG